MPLTIVLNGQSQTLEGLESASTLDRVIAALALQADRVAAELNGAIAPRRTWHTTAVNSGDKLEIVHFVGGGSGPARGSLASL